MKTDFSIRFKKEYRKATKKIQGKFDKRYVLFTKDKNSVLLRNHGLVGNWKGYRSINITGDWRVIYIEEKNRVIFVALGTHSQLYG